MRSRPGTIAAFELLGNLLEETRALYGILSDEHGTVIREYMRNLRRPLPIAAVHTCLASEYSVRLTLAAFLRAALTSLGYWPSLPWPRPCLGALERKYVARSNLGSIPEPETPAVKGYKGFADFDFYTMQRVQEQWERFQAIQSLASAEAKKKPILPGADLVLEANELRRHHGILKPCYPSLSLPADTVAVISRGLRPCNKSLQDSLGNMSCTTLQLEVTEVKHAPDVAFSHVFLVRVQGYSGIFCLKVYDERFFPVQHEEHQYYSLQVSSKRLPCLKYATDIAKQEAAVYERLKDMQGTLIPHCYGAHLVSWTKLFVAVNLIEAQITLPDGWKAYGLLMEFISGPTLADLDCGPLSTAAQEDIVSGKTLSYKSFKAYALLRIRLLVYDTPSESSNFHW